MYNTQSDQIQIEAALMEDGEADVQEFLTVVAAQTIMAGGLQNVNRDSYDDYLKDQEALDNDMGGVEQKEDPEEFKNKVISQLQAREFNTAEMAALRDFIAKAGLNQ